MVQARQRPLWQDLYKGRFIRREYFLALFITWAVGMGALFWGVDQHSNGKAPWALLGLLVVMLAALLAHVRRLHDLGRSGWWVLLSAVPFVSAAGLVYLLFAPSKKPPRAVH